MLPDAANSLPPQACNTWDHLCPTTPARTSFGAPPDIKVYAPGLAGAAAHPSCLVCCFTVEVGVTASASLTEKGQTSGD